MTVEALRRRRPETLGRPARGIRARAAGGRLPDPARPAGSGGRRDRDAAHRLRTRRAIRDERALRAWLLRVATNQALGRRRRTARLVRLDVAPDAAGARRPRVRIRRPRLTLLDGIDDLPLQMRAAVVLRYYADLSVDEVATALGKSPNTIKAQLQTALDRLRVHLADPIGGTPRGGPPCMTASSRIGCARSSEPRATPCR